jgi:hypothetical protein
MISRSEYASPFPSDKVAAGVKIIEAVNRVNALVRPKQQQVNLSFTDYEYARTGRHRPDHCGLRGAEAGNSKHHPPHGGNARSEGWIRRWIIRLPHEVARCLPVPGNDPEMHVLRATRLSETLIEPDAWIFCMFSFFRDTSVRTGEMRSQDQ